MEKKTKIAILIIGLILLVGTIYFVSAEISPITPSLNLNGQDRFTIQNYPNITGVRNFDSILYVQPNNGSDIQASINRCPSTGICKIVIPAGSYYITSPIIVQSKSYFQLIGSGTSTKIFANNSANLDYMIFVNASSYGHVSDMYIDGNKLNQASGAGIGLYILDSNRMTTTNLDIFNSYGDAIRVWGQTTSAAHAGQFSNIKILSAGDNGIYLKANTYDSQFSNIWIGLTTNKGLQIESGANRFANLHIWSSGDDDVSIRNVNENQFTNCYIESSNASGFDIFGTEGNKISNCYIRHNNKGIAADGSSYNIITSSNIIDNTDFGFFTSETSIGNIISNNVFENNSAVGIFLAGKRNTVTNNQVYNNGEEGIKISSSNENLISGNVVYNNGDGYIASDRVGIQVIGTSEDNTISNNRLGDVINGSQIKGILIDTSTVNNFIYGNEFYNLTTPMQQTGTGNIFQANVINGQSQFDSLYITDPSDTPSAKSVIFNLSDTTLADNLTIGGISINANDISSSGTGEKGFLRFVTTGGFGNAVRILLGTSPSNQAFATIRMTIGSNGKFGFGTDVNESDSTAPFANFAGDINATAIKIINTTTTNLNITSPPVACPANSYMTQFLGLTATCTAVSAIPNNLNVSGNFTNNLVPQTTDSYSIGSSLLKWLKGWFVNLDVSGNATLFNINNTGNATINNYYGEMWFNNESVGGTPTVIGSTDVWVNVSGFEQSTSSGGSNNGFTKVNGNALQAQVAGKYKIDYSFSYEAAGTSKEYETAIAINGVIQNNTEIHTQRATANEPTGVSQSGIINLASGDNVYLQIKQITATAVNIGSHAGNINLIRIGN